MKIEATQLVHARQYPDGHVEITLKEVTMEFESLEACRLCTGRIRRAVRFFAAGEMDVDIGARESTEDKLEKAREAKVKKAKIKADVDGELHLGGSPTCETCETEMVVLNTEDRDKFSVTTYYCMECGKEKALKTPKMNLESLEKKQRQERRKRKKEGSADEP